ncbi:interleukin 2 receptor, gamma b [Clarias gariepinus]|uniref:interleukin 2 receptor, gamma b n=1 Tax=Clarias gariepinus TaxID=13013 RepID=UPI00234D031D|nr:interleukin 2 receptor, gamma b [Clarias gariepinus]
MTCLPLVVILLFLQVCWIARAQRSHNGQCITTDDRFNISCLIINLEYIECTWNKPQMQQINYTFSSMFSGESLRECTEYLQEDGQNVGCRMFPNLPIKRFDKFYTNLSVGGNLTTCKDYAELKQRVKLSPPYNLSVSAKNKGEAVCVTWIRNNTKNKKCVEDVVGYQKASGPWKIIKPKDPNSYCLSMVSSGVVYTFKVQSRMSESCGASDILNDWSHPVQWNNPKPTNKPNTSQPQVYWHVLGSVLGVIILISLSLLLYYSERIKVVFVPVVPDPSKSLQDLFKKYNGNVESWVYISRELKEAFEPDYTESPCVVCEPSPTLKTKTADAPMKQPAS